MRCVLSSKFNLVKIFLFFFSFFVFIERVLALLFGLLWEYLLLIFIDEYLDIKLLFISLLINSFFNSVIFIFIFDFLFDILFPGFVMLL